MMRVASLVLLVTIGLSDAALLDAIGAPGCSSALVGESALLQTSAGRHLTHERVLQRKLVGAEGRGAKNWNLNVDDVACPVMGALIRSGALHVDKKGRANFDDVLQSMIQGTGISVEEAEFIATFVAFKWNDTHQEYRERDGKFQGTKWINLFTSNPKDQCLGAAKPENRRLPSGLPCNANTPFQQHGASTTIRDPSACGTAADRFDDWFDTPGVLVWNESLSQRVMKIDGLGALIRRMRLSGKKKGEFALNADNTWEGSLAEEYHPSASKPSQYLPLSQFQAFGAMVNVFVMLARARGETSHVREGDLRRLFVSSKFPRRFRPGHWGFKDIFQVMKQLKGLEAGEEWVDTVIDILKKTGDDADEAQYQGAFVESIQSAFLDDKFRSFPPGKPRSDTR